MTFSEAAFTAVSMLVTAILSYVLLSVKHGFIFLETWFLLGYFVEAQKVVLALDLDVVKKVFDQSL